MVFFCKSKMILLNSIRELTDQSQNNITVPLRDDNENSGDSAPNLVQPVVEQILIR